MLLETPDNLRPAGATSEMIRAADGVSIRCAYWPALSKIPKGTVCLFQGRSEFIEKYYEVIRDLRARGFAVATLDWRGQGGSDRLIEDSRLGHVGEFSHYARDLDAFMRHVALPECPAPFYALAHSMGGAVLFGTLGSRISWFERVVVTAPMIDLALTPPAARWMARTLSAIGLGRAIIPGWSPLPVALKPFLGNPVTSDPIRYEATAGLAKLDPRISIGAPTIGWVHAAFRIMDELSDPLFGREWRTPCLMVLSGQDHVVSSPAAELFAAKLRATRAITIPGALHEVMQERDPMREGFWAAFDAFVPGAGR
jgi:lysophospholipase